jgi:hypothetical protein
MAKLYHEKGRLPGFEDLSEKMKAVVTDAFLRERVSGTEDL